MGKVKIGVLGDFTGKVGHVVGRMWKGRNVMAAIPASYNDKNSLSQRMVRARFKTLAQMVGNMYGAIEMGFAGKAKQMKFTEGNAFMRINWGAVSVSSPDDVTVNFPSLLLSVGSLTPVGAAGTVNWGAGTHLTVKFDLTETAGMPRTDDADEVYAVLYSPDLKQTIVSNPAYRVDTNMEVEVPAGWNGMDVHLWLMTIGHGTETNGLVSNSQYVGHGEIQ